MKKKIHLSIHSMPFLWLYDNFCVAHILMSFGAEHRTLWHCWKIHFWNDGRAGRNEKDWKCKLKRFNCVVRVGVYVFGTFGITYPSTEHTNWIVFKWFKQAKMIKCWRKKKKKSMMVANVRDWEWDVNVDSLFVGQF